MAVESLIFKTDALYLLLSDRGDDFTFHWGLYLARSPADGDVFHLINLGKSTAWKYDAISSKNTATSAQLLLALQVGVLDPALHKALGDRLRQIPVQYSTRFRENITCRVWIKEALFALDEEGYISIKGGIEGVNNIEIEARSEAMVSRINRSKGNGPIGKISKYKA